MRTFPLAMTAWLLGAAAGVAQEPPRAPLNRGDATFVLGWQNLRKEQPPQQQDFGNNDWLHGIFYGGAGAGWYWTDHLKTHVDVGAGTRARQYRYQYSVLNGQTTSSSSRLSVQEQSVAIGSSTSSSGTSGSIRMSAPASSSRARRSGRSISRSWCSTVRHAAPGRSSPSGSKDPITGCWRVPSPRPGSRRT